MNRAAPQRAAIRRLTEALAAQRPVGDSLQIIVEEARRLTSAGTAALCLLCDEREMLDYVAVSGDNAEQLVGLRVRVTDSLSDTVIESGSPAIFSENNVVEADLFEDAPGFDGPRGGPAVQERTSVHRVTGARTAAIVPIVQDRRIVGTLSAINKRADRGRTSDGFDEDDVDALALLADLAALTRTIDRTTSAARVQARELDVLYDAARTVSVSLNVQDVMDGVLTAICSHIDYHKAALLLINDERSHLFVAAERGLSSEEREHALPLDDAMACRVIDSGLPRLISDTEVEPNFTDLSRRGAALSAMVVPVRSRDDIRGLLIVTSLERHAYHLEDLNLLAAVASQAGIAIDNAALYEDAQRQAQEATALFDLSQHVNATLHLDRVLSFVADTVLNLLKVDKFALMLYDRAQERLVPRLTRGLDDARFAGYRPRAGEGIAGWVFEWQTPQAIVDVAADPRDASASLAGMGVESALCVPMHVGNDVVGVVQAMSSRTRLFTVAEMELLYTISNLAAVASVNATLYQDARARSHEMRRYFRRVAQAIGSALDDQNLPELLAYLTTEMMRADRCSIYQVEGDLLRLRARSRFRSSNLPDAVVPLGVGLAGTVARRGQSLRVADLQAEPRSRAHSWLQRDRLASYLGVPVKIGRRTVAVVEIYSTERREFTDEEVQLLATFVRRAKIAEKMVLSLP